MQVVFALPNHFKLPDDSEPKGSFSLCSVSITGTKDRRIDGHLNGRHPVVLLEEVTPVF
jgi:hypothetical protein